MRRRSLSTAIRQAAATPCAWNTQTHMPTENRSPLPRHAAVIGAAGGLGRGTTERHHLCLGVNGEPCHFRTRRCRTFAVRARSTHASAITGIPMLHLNVSRLLAAALTAVAASAHAGVGMA